ncbi:MAG: DUF2155 domain-containing protein [Alphaproteobacteria bacterium]|nr:DUF2155 domain-containing protein [Alphaproteobacteria bacterium]
MSFLIFALAATCANAYIDRDTAVVRIMNKAAGKTQTVNIPVGGTIEHEKMTITVHSCKVTDPFDAADSFMFVDVHDAAHGKIFGGWMSHNEPGDNPLQNQDYDLWLVNCQ